MCLGEEKKGYEELTALLREEERERREEEQRNKKTEGRRDLTGAEALEP